MELGFSVAQLLSSWQVTGTHDMALMNGNHLNQRILTNLQLTQVIDSMGVASAKVTQSHLLNYYRLKDCQPLSHPLASWRLTGIDSTSNTMATSVSASWKLVSRSYSSEITQVPSLRWVRYACSTFTCTNQSREAATAKICFKKCLRLKAPSLKNSLTTGHLPNLKVSSQNTIILKNSFRKTTTMWSLMTITQNQILRR